MVLTVSEPEHLSVWCRQRQGSLGQRSACDALSLLLSLISEEDKDNSRAHKKALLPRPQSILLLYPTHARGHTLQFYQQVIPPGCGGWLRPQPRPELGARELPAPKVSPVSRCHDGQYEAGTLGSTSRGTCPPNPREISTATQGRVELAILSLCPGKDLKMQGWGIQRTTTGPPWLQLLWLGSVYPPPWPREAQRPREGHPLPKDPLPSLESLSCCIWPPTSACLPPPWLQTHWCPTFHPAQWKYGSAFAHQAWGQSQ